MKRQSTEWEERFANHHSNTYMEVYKLDNQMTNNPIEKQGESMKSYSTLATGKCKSKPQ